MAIGQSSARRNDDARETRPRLEDDQRILDDSGQCSNKVINSTEKIYGSM